MRSVAALVHVGNEQIRGSFESLRRAVEPSALVVGFSVLVTACGASSAAITPITTPTVAAAEAEQPSVKVTGECIDGTGSMPAGLPKAAAEATAAMVENWVPPASDHSTGSPPVAGLDLSVRKVIAGSSLSSVGELVHVVLPGVPSVIRKPDVADPNYLELLKAWRAQAAAADQATQAQRVQAAQAAAAIRAANLYGESSEIFGCLQGLALAQRGSRRRLVLVSDLEQTDPPQSGLGGFTGAAVLVVHACSLADRCAAQENAWRQALLTQGAADVEFTRPERVGQDLPAWLEG